MTGSTTGFNEPVHKISFTLLNICRSYEGKMTKNANF